MTKMTIDGNTAASHVAYAFSEVAAIYPKRRSTPSRLPLPWRNRQMNGQPKAE